MRIKNIILIAVLTLVSPVIIAQTNNVATYRGGAITEREFKLRYELMPHLSDPSADDVEERSNFLYSLVAEYLLAKESETNTSVFSDERITKALSVLEKMYVRDALYKQIIEPKLNITPREIERAREKSKTKLFVHILSSTDSTEIYSVYAQLQKGVPFDSLVKQQQGGVVPDPLIITFGTLREEWIEDTLYALKKGTYTTPITNEYSYFIFKLIGSEVTQGNPFEKNPTGAEPIEQQLRTRRAQVIGSNYLIELLGDVEIDFNILFVNEIIDKTEEYFKGRRGTETIDSTYYLTEEGIEYLRKAFAERVNNNLLQSSEVVVTLSDYLAYVQFEGFVVKSFDKPMLQRAHRTLINKAVDNELISREGYRLGLNELPEVRTEMSRWKVNMLSQSLLNTFRDSVAISEDDAVAYYNERMKQRAGVTEVKIRELFTTDLLVMQQVLDLMDKGESFASLTQKYNARDLTQSTAGVIEFFPITMNKELGDRAVQMNKGEIFGPFPVKGGYSMIELLDKRVADSTTLQSFTEVKEVVFEQARIQKLQDKFDNYVASLAKKYDVQINESVLNAIDLNPVQLFTYRYMGFGGRITAFPYTTPQYKWFKIFKQKEEL